MDSAAPRLCIVLHKRDVPADRAGADGARLQGPAFERGGLVRAQYAEGADRTAATTANVDAACILSHAVLDDGGAGEGDRDQRKMSAESTGMRRWTYLFESTHLPRIELAPSK